MCGCFCDKYFKGIVVSPQCWMPASCIVFSTGGDPAQEKPYVSNGRFSLALSNGPGIMKLTRLSDKIGLWNWLGNRQSTKVLSGQGGGMRGERIIFFLFSFLHKKNASNLQAWGEITTLILGIFALKILKSAATGTYNPFILLFFSHIWMACVWVYYVHAAAAPSLCFGTLLEGKRLGPSLTAFFKKQPDLESFQDSQLSRPPAVCSTAGPFWDGEAQ